MRSYNRIVFETPEATYELTLAVTAKDDVHVINKMPSSQALALVKALKTKHNGDMDAVWAELDKVAVDLLGYPLSQKFKGAKLDL